MHWRLEEFYFCFDFDKVVSICAEFYTLHKLTNSTYKRNFENMLVSCIFCLKVCQDMAGLEQHLRVHTNERPFTCQTCGADFPAQGTLTVHHKVHNEDKAFRCKTCKTTFRFRSNLTAHIRAVHEKLRPHSCEFCPKAFFQIKGLDIHIRTHLNEQIYKCDICNQRFKALRNMKSHIQNVHNHVKNYECSNCPKKFVEKARMKDHFMRRHGKMEDRPLPCSKCEKRFCSKRDLRVHMKGHNLKSKFLCTHCQQSFPSCQALLAHTKAVHQEESPYFCVLCKTKKYFPKLSSLELHISRHLNERPHWCLKPKCSAGFKSANNLRQHVRVKHTKERPYSCEICEKTFPFLEDRNRHIRMHLNEKHYQCKFCDKSYFIGSSLNDHVRKVHNSINST